MAPREIPTYRVTSRGPAHQLPPAPTASPRGGLPASVYWQRVRRRLLAVDALTIIFVASVAVAVALFLSDRAFSGFMSFAGALTSLGVVAGLVAMDLVLVMFLLSARVPVIDRTIGQDKAMMLHGSLGKPILYLLIMHGDP